MTPARIAEIAKDVFLELDIVTALAERENSCGCYSDKYNDDMCAVIKRAIRLAVNEALEEAAKECMEHAERVPEQYEALGLNDAAGIISELKLPEEP